MKMFTCDICAKTFTAKRNMLRHRRSHVEGNELVCTECNKKFKRKDNLISHQRFACRQNEKHTVHTPQDNAEDTSRRSEDDSFVEVETALKNRIKTYSVHQGLEGDIATVLNTLKYKIIEKLDENLRIYTALKFNLFLECAFFNSQGENCTRNFKTMNTIVYKTTYLPSVLPKNFEKIQTEKGDCEMKGSGWSFDRIIRLELRINKYNPLRGAQFIRLPSKIANKKAVINVVNMDIYCFKYALLSKYVVNHPERVANYINNNDLEQMYDWNCIKFPVELNDIKTFETVNNISINVFGLDETDQVYPLKVCDKMLEDHTDLLYVTNEKTSHYCLIKDFTKLVRSQKTQHEHSIEICKRCFAHFDDQCGSTAEEKLAVHNDDCVKHDAVRQEFPSYDKLYFKNHHRSKRVRFVLYADFETMLQPIISCQGNPSKSWSNAYQHHIPYSYCYLLKDSEDEHTILREYRGPEAAKHFMETLVKDIRHIDKILYSDKKLDVPVLTREEEKAFHTADICHICKKGNFTDVNFKVKDHCHVSGSYRGAAHRHCNLFFQDQHFVPCFIHNLSGFDSHFIVRELGYDTSTINVIPNTEEKYISFSKYIKVEHARRKHLELRFLDSIRFMPSSLSKLADSLPDDEFHETKKQFPDTFKLVTKKGVFPYEYITDLGKLEERELPPTSEFYSSLTGADVTKEMYEHATNVWTQFDVQTLGQYSDIYNKSDVLILCDVFEHFRKTCMETYDLDPAYYFTVPGLAWEAMLKFTNIELELIKDSEMLLMFEKGIRGGITQCVKRYSIANNKYLPDTYNKDLSDKYIFYVDATNLYGLAMTKALPYGGFEWADVSPENIMALPEDSNEGFVLEVDLEYPKLLHDDHADFPFCTETKIPDGRKQKKLLATVEDKEKYVIHYVALKQALTHGLILKKIHRAIKFQQKPWLKPYIELNAEKRKAGMHDFEKDFYKLMCNSIYGKTMEQVRNRLDIRLVSDPIKLEKLIAKSNFIDRTTFGENLVGVHMRKTKVVFNKPIYLGMCILDLSKVHMYTFHYDTMLPVYRNRIHLCYQDTDSFIYEIETEDLYEDMKTYIDHLDTSNYPSDHPRHSRNNKNVLGKFKDESKGEIIKGFVGLRSKMYAVKMKTSATIRKIKGITKAAVKRKIHFGSYVKCLFKGKRTLSKNNIISSKRHEVKTVVSNKVTLSPDDDKRHILEDKIHTLPHGHWRLVCSENMKRPHEETDMVPCIKKQRTV